MNGNRYVLTGGLVVLAGVLIFLFIMFHRPEAVRERSVPVATPTYSDGKTSHLRRVHLYFSGLDHSHLVSEARELPDSGDPTDIGKHILTALIDGPHGDGVRTLPATATVRDVFIADDGTAYVDFDEFVATDHPGGVQMELISIYSVVNSLVLNLEAVSTVKILIDGRESDTLAGHMDLRFPFKANILLIK